MVVSVLVFQFLNFLSSGSFGRYRWSLKQFSRSRCWYIPLIQQTDERLNADDEDAHPSTDTVDSADEDESAGSASQQITDDETVQEDTLDMDTSQHTEEIGNLNPVLRSTRERWSLKQFSRSRCWYIPDVSYW
jgi:hypothetical protein